MGEIFDNFRIVEDDDGRRFAVHYRELGSKASGIYPGKKWSDVAINGVSFDTTCRLDNYDEFLFCLNEGSIRKESQTSNILDRKVPLDIKYSESNGIESGKKEVREKTSVRWKKGVKDLKRKRGIPPKKKKYPTKPRHQVDEDGNLIVKVKAERDHFKWEINYAQREIEEEYDASDSKT